MEKKIQRFVWNVGGSDIKIIALSFEKAEACCKQLVSNQWESVHFVGVFEFN